jgi:DNA-binding FrmR family transcriptional regulator
MSMFDRVDCSSMKKKDSVSLSKPGAEHLTRRVNRVIGQLKGIQRMSEEGRDCNDIIQQVSAVKKAIDGLTVELLVEDVIPYIPPIRQKVISEMIHRVISL